MKIERPKYVEQLMNARDNGLAKIVSKYRECYFGFSLKNRSSTPDFLRNECPPPVSLLMTKLAKKKEFRH